MDPDKPNVNPDVKPAEPTSTPNNNVIKPSSGVSMPVEPAPQTEATASQPSMATPPKPPKVRRRLSKKLLVVVLALLLVGGAVAYWFVLRDKDDADTASIETKEIEHLRIGNADGPANNLFPKEGIGVSYSQNRQVYEGLVGNSGGKYVPLLATSWTNPDEKTWLFELKPNVTFHSGKTMKAEDVKRSIEAIQKLDNIAFLTSTIATVEVIDDLQVKITTNEPDSLLLNRLALAYITDQDVTDTEGNNGTGAYKLDTTATYDEKTATFVANDQYHQGRPKTRKLTYNIYESDEEMNKDLKSGKIDIMETIPDEKAIEGLSEAGFASTEYESQGTFGLYMNMLRDDSPLKNKEVRRALSLAVDRENLVTELANDNLPANQVIPKSLPGYDADVKFPDFNVDAAKKALADAGYADGVTLEYVYVKEVQQDPPILIKQLEAAGFTIEAKAFDEVDPALDLVFEGEFDLFSAAYTSDLGDSRDFLGAILESTEQAYPIYNDPAYDKLLADSDSELDPTKRIAILQEANKYIADNYLWIPLRSTVYVAFYKAGTDISLDFNGGGNLGVYYWKVGQKEIKS